MNSELLFLVTQLTKELQDVTNDIHYNDDLADKEFQDFVLTDIRRALDILNKVNAETEEYTNDVESCFKPRLEWVFKK